jgi:Na+-driven multidrug efflux pump
MFVTWQSKHGHDSTEFTIIMANHNFATEVIDLRKIKAQPMTAVGEAAQSITAQRFGQNKASRASRNEE